MIRAVQDQEVCVTISILDGVVLARSAYHHSANYRSAMLFGRASLINDPDAKIGHLKMMMETIAPGRFERLRPVLSQELKATSILTLPIDCFSVKTRSGDVSEDEADLDWPVWAGVVPYKQQLAEPVRASGVGDQFDPPALIRPA
jgi:nitroimidazol reductase NimA-like FMN-containing flavoprotein (pyridoxamine 5'-phosphate oxidase superfamily)